MKERQQTVFQEHGGNIRVISSRRGVHCIRGRNAAGRIRLRKVLVVEDSPLLQKGYDLIFRRSLRDGCQVLHAFDGREGLELLADHPDCELIILDLELPVMSGSELLRRLKAHPVHHRIPVIIITSERCEATLVRCVREGADAYIVKPFNIAELHRLIERLLDPHEAALVACRTRGMIGT